MLQIIHIIVALIAALTVTILSLFQNVTFYQMSIRLVIVIPVFFILGMFFRSYLTKLFAPPPEEEIPEEETEGESETEEGESENEGEPMDTEDDFN